MGAFELLLIYSLSIVAMSLLGGSLPLLLKWTSEQLHLMVALSAGVFIGATFIILLPEAVESMNAQDALILVMVGFIVILLIETVLQHRHQEECDEHTIGHQHVLTSTTAFIGLSVHSVMDGFALGVALILGEDLGMVVFLAILAHKAIDVFSLTTTFRLAEIKRRKALMYMGLFSLITPIAALVAFPLLEWLQGLEVGVPLALAGGTFMYVGIYDLLPEAFHEKRGHLKAFALVAAGILVMYVLGTIISASGI